MKIIIKRGKPIRVYHHPREVIVHPKSKRVEIFNSDGSILETFELIDRKIEFLEDIENDTSEALITLEVK